MIDVKFRLSEFHETFILSSEKPFYELHNSYTIANGRLDIN